MMGLFGDLFDFDGDGMISDMEQAAEFGFFMALMDDCKQQELTYAGLDPEELAFMDEPLRRETILAAGLSPDDYDF